MRTLSRGELTAALACRQLLVGRARVGAAEAVRRLTPLQGQHAPAPYLALAARVEGFARGDLEAAIDARAVVKTTLMRHTLHVVAAEDYPAFAQLTRQSRLRAWRNRLAPLDLDAVEGSLREWFSVPRTNAEIREFVGGFDGAPEEGWGQVGLARTLLPLVQLPPAGYWDDKRRPQFVVDARPLPDVGDAAAHVLARYLAAFGPATRGDVAQWAGLAQRDFAAAFARLPLVSYRDPEGRELLDLPDAPLPPESLELPVRFLGHWDQPLLAYKERSRILPDELVPLQLTISGDPTVTVDGRVAASWAVARDGDTAELTVTPHVELGKAVRAAVRAEAKRTARFAEPGVRRVVVRGV